MSEASEVAEWKKLATGLADMARDLLAQESVQNTLDRIVGHAVDLVDGCDAAGILVLRGGKVQTMAATDNVARASDHKQAQLRSGPCFDAAYHKQQVYRLADLTTAEHRWPDYASWARELGVGSMMGFLLYTAGEDDLGALNLYSKRPDAFGDRSEQAGWILASHAAVALSSAHTTAQLHEAIGSRQDVGAAIGILMERYRLDERAAFDLLARLSQHHNIKLVRSPGPSTPPVSSRGAGHRPRGAPRVADPAASGRTGRPSRRRGSRRSPAGPGHRSPPAPATPAGWPPPDPAAGARRVPPARL